MNVPAFLPYYVLAGSVGIVAAILIGARRAVADADISAHERGRAATITAVVVIGWFAIALLLALVGAYDAAADRPPTIQYGIFLPILIGGILIWRSQTVRRIIDAVPQPWLVAVQVYRAAGVIFIILYAMGLAPALFAWPAGIGDILVGLAAPVVARAYAHDPKGNAGRVLAWNVLGLADLAVAITTRFLTSPSPLQRFAFDLPNELISAFPLVLIPTFLVPISILLHIATLAKLRQLSPRRAHA